MAGAAAIFIFAVSLIASCFWPMAYCRHACPTGALLDLGGIGPGYAVDRIGERLRELGSQSHLVELGGEVRAWGERAAGVAWRVAVRGTGEVVELPAGEALATSTARTGFSPIDPRTGRVVAALINH